MVTRGSGRLTLEGQRAGCLEGDRVLQGQRFDRPSSPDGGTVGRFGTVEFPSGEQSVLFSVHPLGSLLPTGPRPRKAGA
jgi:hypothetical protein